ncbi:MAG: DUF177 domain-containing protein [Actinomycetota bacterium]|nr:DUF177 domain-containing protein [Actinomycetota bacterium]MDQ3680986.1 DUF177 domain-containing protein [Actinomycetota bacterium]
MRSSPFLVNVAALGLTPGTRRHAHRQGPLPGLAVSGSSLPSGAQVEVDVVLEAVPGAVVARGEVLAPWQGECRRCLRTVSGQLRSEVLEVFEHRHDPEQTYPLVGDQLDLGPLARDAVLLELPQAPLCHQGCLGLCAVCGADLNEAACGCGVETGDARWAALDVLRET